MSTQDVAGKDPGVWFEDTQLSCCLNLERIKRVGVTLGELAHLALCNGQASQQVYASRDIHPEDIFRQQIQRVMAQNPDSERIIVSFDRGRLGQTGSGHFSPIGAYDRRRDMVLVMDVARFKYFQFWCPVSLLWDSMCEYDPSTGKPRGYMVIKNTSKTSLCTSPDPLTVEYKQDIRICWTAAVKSLIDNLANLEEDSGSSTASEDDSWIIRDEELALGLWDPGDKPFEDDSLSTTSTIRDLCHGVRANHVKIKCEAETIEDLNRMQSSIQRTTTFSMLQRLMGAGKESYVNTMLLIAMASTPENSLPTSEASRQRLRSLHMSLQVMAKEDRQLLSDKAIEEIRKIQSLLLICA